MLFTLCIACIGICGCAAGSAVLAMTRSTDQFLAYDKDPRVRYEPGAAGMARQVARALPAALHTVQEMQYRGFAAPVRIYVCASIDSFKAYGAPSGREGGFVLNKRLFISPKPGNTAERIPALLAHELSHLQIEQQIGLFRAARIPSWFKEGLAVRVANGGGAETVTEDQARVAIRQNEYFQPETEGSLLFPKRARDYGLVPHLFYREAAMFVGYLYQADSANFRKLLLAVEDGLPFANAFRDAYGAAPGEVWTDFLTEMKKSGNAFHAYPQRNRFPALVLTE